MDYFTVGAIVWLAIFALLGLLKGFWKALAAAASLALAYWASVYFAPPLAQFLSHQFSSIHLSETVWWIASAVVIFMVAGLLVRLLVLAVAKPLPIHNGLINRLGGGLISVGYGAVLGAALLWGLAFLADTWNLREKNSATQSEWTFDTSAPVVTWSRRMMAQWVNWNVQQSGGSEAVAGMSAAMVERPAEVMANVQATVQSPAFKQMVASEKLQRIVQQRDAHALQRTPEFNQFLQQPAVRELRDQIAPEANGWSDQKIAEETVDLWTKVEQLKTRPEVAEVLNDPEVQAFLQGGGKITPSLLTKGQKLLALLGNDSSALANVEVPELFQWHDEAGELHVTDYQGIPENKKAEAEPIKF